jgi:hypothetical protein
MRLILLTAYFLAGTAAAFAEDGPDARSAYVERRGLLETDARCRLLSPSVRDAIQVGALQARGSLLRAGWSSTQTRELEQAVVSAARARTCDDARTTEAVNQARRSFGQWANSGSMTFPGWERPWIAQRSFEGWRLRQEIDAPTAATFGVRQQRGGTQQLVLAIPIQRGQTPPSSARLVMRDAASARAPEVNLNQRVAYGLAAGAPSPTTSLAFPSTRALERGRDGMLAVFVFPDNSFGQLTALDPRESVQIEVESGRASRRLLIEVGDVAAARAFLTIRR